jgi:hypothetical protein
MAMTYPDTIPDVCDTSWTLTAKILQELNAGGGGSWPNTITTAEVWAAAGVPAHTPTITRQIYFDTNTGAQYNWYSGVWH